MTVVVDITVSVDGFIAREDGSAGPLHDWFFGGDEATGEVFRTGGADTTVLRETLARTGAIVAGRATYDLTRGWDGDHPAGAPVVVVTHHPPAAPPTGRTPLSFVDGVAEALAAAGRLAGDRDVVVMGGASVIRQVLTGRLAGFVQVHVAPVILGSGIRLVEGRGDALPLVADRVVTGPRATHLRYRLA